MSLPFEIEEKLEAIKSQINSMNVELVEVSFKKHGGRNVLTFLVDKPGGVTLQDCVEVNQRLSAFFDEVSENPLAKDGFIKGSYYLEVNSPGLDRPLRVEKDFLKAIGETLRVVCREEGGYTRTIVGRLESAKDGGIEIKVKDGSVRNLVLGDVVKALREIQIRR